MTERVFTLEEANAELPALREHLPPTARRAAGADRGDRADRGCGRARRRGCGGSRLVPHQQTLKDGGRVPRRARHPAARSRHGARRLPGGSRGSTGLPVLAARRGRRRVLPRGADRLRRAATPVSTRPVVVLAGATREHPAARDRAAAARRRPPVRRRRRRPRGDRRRRRASCGGATIARGSRRAGTGRGDGSGGSRRRATASTGCCSPALVERDVVVTNARGVFDDAIAEWVIGATGHGDRLGATIVAIRHATRAATVGTGTRRRHAARDRGAGAARARDRVTVLVRPRHDGEAVGRARPPTMRCSTGRGPDDFYAMRSGGRPRAGRLPLTAETRHRFDAAAFAAMRPSARFSTSAAAARSTSAALIDALRRDLSPARRSTSTRRSRCRPRRPCGRCPTSSCRRTSAATSTAGRRRSSRCSSTTSGGSREGEPLRNPVDVDRWFRGRVGSRRWPSA